jgi:hypothetical protein
VPDKSPELARQYGRYGYRKVAELLRQAGWIINDKPRWVATDEATTLMMTNLQPATDRSVCDHQFRI